MTGEDISTKPSTWTGLSSNRQNELAATKGAILFHKQLRRIVAPGAFLARAQVRDVVVSLGDLSKVDFRSATLADVMAQESRFDFCKFSDSVSPRESGFKIEDLKSTYPASIEKCVFSGARFILADLCNVQARFSDFEAAIFAFANCTGIVFDACNLSGSNFLRSSLNFARLSSIHPTGPLGKPIQFQEADCSGAEFTDCDLRGAAFTRAMLDHAKFHKEVDLTGADFTKASLVEADLSGAKGLKEDQLRKARTLVGVKLNEDLIRALAKQIASAPALGAGPSSSESKTGD